VIDSCNCELALSEEKEKKTQVNGRLKHKLLDAYSRKISFERTSIISFPSSHQNSFLLFAVWYWTILLPYTCTYHIYAIRSTEPYKYSVTFTWQYIAGGATATVLGGILKWKGSLVCVLIAISPSTLEWHLIHL